MKIRKVFVSLFLAIFVLILSVFTVSAESVSALTDKVKALGEKYGFEVVVSEVLPHTRGGLSEEEINDELKILEEKLIAGREALQKNHQMADAYNRKIIEDGRFLIAPPIASETLAAKTTHTVYRYQTIGSVYPNATTIRCFITADINWSTYRNRYFWGSVRDKESSLYSGKGENWEETDSQVTVLDGGRTLKVEFWGDLEEKYEIGGVEYTFTSKNWRIWYEAACPAE